jgi:hypothetical protein
MQEQRDQHTYELWYMQNSLAADYGSFTCDQCSRNFYHSPATIYCRQQVKYACCCGYCTNEIIYKDWYEKPYR